MNNISKFCSDNDISFWYNDNNGFINVDEDVVIIDDTIKKIPVKFGIVQGHFETSTSITTLENCPTHVIGNFVICSTEIKLRQCIFNISVYGIIESEILWKF